LSRRHSCLCTLLACVAPIWAQFDHSGFAPDPGFEFRRGQQQQNMSLPLQGRLELPDSVEPSRLRVVLVDSSRRTVVADTYCSYNGGFEFPGVPSGIYDLQVRSLNGDVVHQSSISLPSATSLVIKMRNPTQNIQGRSVSAKRLGHKIPKSARKNYDKARERLIAGKTDGVEDRLAHAIEIDPDFFEALGALGAVYLQTHRFREAIAMLQRAQAIDDHDAPNASNLALAYLQVHQLVEAEAAARGSIEANALNPRARFFLAVSLLEQGKERQEAMFQLKQAKDSFPPAQALLARLESEWWNASSAKSLSTR
jgi:tetratricopeptide (TPR) repeat protein